MPSKNSSTEAPKKNLLLEARNAATRRILAEPDVKQRFEQFYVEEAEARGVTYTPELTPEQKREQQLRELLAEDPTLIDRVTGGDSAPATVPDVEV